MVLDLRTVGCTTMDKDILPVEMDTIFDEIYDKLMVGRMFESHLKMPSATAIGGAVKSRYLNDFKGFRINRFKMRQQSKHSSNNSIERLQG